MKLCRKLIPTLTLLAIVAAPASGAVAEARARPQADAPNSPLAVALLDLGHRIATLWSSLTDGTPTPTIGGPDGSPTNEGQGGHDPNGCENLPAEQSPAPSN